MDTSGRISDRSPSVLIVYEKGGELVEKLFTDPYAARRFYTQKLKDGQKPALKRAE